MKRAFTMAEVLITIGILGIVMAMILPTLVTNYRKKMAVEGLKTVYSKLSEVIKYSEMYNGSVKSWDYTLDNDKFIEIYLAPYIETFKVNDSAWKIYSLTGDLLEGGDYLLKFSRFSLSNGTLIAISTSKTDKGSSIMIYADINGLKGPNVVGIDVFRMSITKTYGFTLGADRSDENTAWSHNSITNKNRRYLLSPNKGCCSAGPGDLSQFGFSAGDACSLLIMLDGWKISDDYPWKYRQ